MTDLSTQPNDQQVAATPEGAVSAAPAGVTEQAAPAAGSQSEAAPAGADSTSAAATGDVIRPEGIPDELWEDGNGLKVGDLVSAYRDLKAQADERTADLPATPADYELKLSEAVQVPEGFNVDIDPEAPFFSDVTKELHALGVGKAGVQKLVDAYARAQIAEQTQAVESFSAEKAKLGDRADARIGAVQTWLTANLKADAAKALMGSLFTAEHVQALETIISLRKDPVPGPGGQQSSSDLSGLRGADLLDAIRNKAA